MVINNGGITRWFKFILSIQDSFDLVPLPSEFLNVESDKSEGRPMSMEFLPPPPDSPPPELPQSKGESEKTNQNSFRLSMIPAPDF